MTETYSTKVYMAQGGDELVVGAGGKISNAGTQASHIANLATGATNAQIATAFNTLLVAIEGVGITATS